MTAEKPDQPRATPWYVYMLRTRDGSLYTGISTDPERRLCQHERGLRGARSLRGKGPLQLVWIEAASDRSLASKREAAIKKLAKVAKEQLVESGASGLQEVKTGSGYNRPICRKP
jgi:putative endonuclease